MKGERAELRKRCTFFKTPAEFRRWLKKHHAAAIELWAGFYKRDSGEPGMTWPESVDQALCFGWIDGVRRGLDDRTYAIRFTPRRPESTWSAVNIRRAQELAELGLMQPAGLKAFQARAENKSRIYSYEQKEAGLGEPYEEKFKKSKAAWKFFQAQPPSYRKKACWWVMSARQEETRLKRLEKVIQNSSRGQRI